MVDDRNLQKWGFGAAPISDRMRIRYDAAVSVGLEITRKDVPHPLDHLNDISELKGMFNRCVRKDQWDWFSVHASLGRPPHRACVRIAGLLAGYRTALKNNRIEHASDLRRKLCDSELFHCLTAYSGHNILLQGSAGYLYVLSTREQPDVLKIGMTDRTPEQRVKEINSATGLIYPYSVRMIVQLYNASQIERLVHSKLSAFRIRKDREFFRINFTDAAKCIQQIVDEYGIRVRAEGLVRKFVADRGFGFLVTPGGTEVFFHVSSWPDQFCSEIVEGTRVSFRIISTPKGATARDIEIETGDAI